MVLDNVMDDMPRELLSMLVENISGLDESRYSLEIIWETNRAVITFSSPAGRTGHQTADLRSAADPFYSVCANIQQFALFLIRIITPQHVSECEAPALETSEVYVLLL